MGRDVTRRDATVNLDAWRLTSDATTTTNEQLLALTTFSFMAKQTEGLAGPELSTLNDCGQAGCGFTKFYQFKGVVGVYAGFWAYTVILIAMYSIRKAPPPGTEFASYALFTAAMVTFVAMSITECASVVLSSSYYVCKNADYSVASLIFATATIVLNCLTCAFAWRQWGELKFVGLPKTLSSLTKTSPG